MSQGLQPGVEIFPRDYDGVLPTLPLSPPPEGQSGSRELIGLSELSRRSVMGLAEHAVKTCNQEEDLPEPDPQQVAILRERKDSLLRHLSEADRSKTVLRAYGPWIKEKVEARRLSLADG